MSKTHELLLFLLKDLRRYLVCYNFCNQIIKEMLNRMRDIKTLRSFNQIKILSDAHRMKILCLLMDSPANLTGLARALKQSPAWVRHHILALQAADLVELTEIRKTGKVTEKYYQAKAGAFL